MRTRTAVAFAAIGSGVPSTLATIARGGELLESTRAAGTLLVGESGGPSSRLIAGAVAHTGISAFWGFAIWRGLPEQHTVLWGGVAGLGIAALDLGVIARRVPAIRRLPRGPQVADHVAFGLIIGWCRARSWGRPQ